MALFELSNYKAFPLGITVGRQILSYGDERLIGPLEWNNFTRTFDAVKIRLQQPHYWIDLFTSSVVVITRGRVGSVWFMDFGCTSGS